jgi:hypothetical protein
MAFNTDSVLRDINGVPGPQIYNPVTDSFVALSGTSDGGMYVHTKPEGSGILTTTFYTSSALESAKQVKTTAGVLFSLSAYNNNTVSQYLMVFDINGTPATGAIPNLVPRVIPANSTFDLTPQLLTQWGFKFLNGLYVAISTTQATYTAQATAYAYFNVFYL